MSKTAKQNPHPMTPVFVPVRNKRRDTKDTVSFDLDTSQIAWNGFQPGQFNMLYAFGVGEIPISISGDPAKQSVITHTVRAVGAVSEAIVNLEDGDMIGLRGPFGGSWPVDECKGKDVVIMAGGLGLAPLSPLIYEIVNHRNDYGEVALVYGTRDPESILFENELDGFKNAGIQVEVTVDRAEKEWKGQVGVVTSLLPDVYFNSDNVIANLCGPEVMMRFGAAALRDEGVASDRMYISMERNMKCGVVSCGHCQFGPTFLCREGPVFRYDKVQQILNIREI